MLDAPLCLRIPACAVFQPGWRRGLLFGLEGCLLVVTSEELRPASESEKNGHVGLQHHHQWLLATYTRNNPVVALDRMDSHERGRVVYWYSIQFCMLVKDGLMSFVERSVFCPGTRPSSST